MAGGMARAEVRRQLDALFAVGMVGELPDGELLRLSAGASESVARAAFGALIDRHGPMVLRACRQATGDAHDAEDAFQSTFLVLARRAGSVRNADSVASWLLGVALRVAARIRSGETRRRAFERRAETPRADPPGSWPELHEEIARLPGRYREPVVLCYLEGMTTEEAARRLCCPKGTILSRLSRGRDRLRRNLTRRGIAPAAGLLAAAEASGAAAVMVPPALLGATARSATRVLLDSAIEGTVSASVIRLTEGVLKAMMWTKCKIAGLAALATLSLGFAAVAAVAASGDRGPSEAGPAGPRQGTPPQAGPTTFDHVVVPPRADPAGKPAAPRLESKDQGELDRILDAWEASCKDYRTLAVEFDRFDRSAEWGDRSFRGELVFQGPDQACLEFHRAFVDGYGQRTGRFASEPADRLVLAGGKLAQFDWDSRKIYVYSARNFLAKAMTEQGSIPFAILFRVGAAGLKERYQVELLKQSPREALIRIQPRRAADKMSWDQALIWLDRGSSRPNKLRLYLAGGKTTQEFKFSGEPLGFRPNVAVDLRRFEIKPQPGWRLMEAPGGDGSTALEWLFNALDRAPKVPDSEPAGPPRPPAAD